MHITCEPRVACFLTLQRLVPPLSAAMSAKRPREEDEHPPTPNSIPRPEFQVCAV